MAYTQPLSVLTISMYAQLVVLDLPDVLEAFRHRAVALGLDDRAETLPGDYYEVELPPACFDRVIIANVLHLERPTRARVLISRLAPTLRSGGDLMSSTHSVEARRSESWPTASTPSTSRFAPPGARHTSDRLSNRGWRRRASCLPDSSNLNPGPARSQRSGPTFPARILPRCGHHLVSKGVTISTANTRIICTAMASDGSAPLSKAMTAMELSYRGPHSPPCRFRFTRRNLLGSWVYRGKGAAS